MECIFCKINDGSIPSYTIYENDYVRCFLDINPNTAGDTLIVPKKHYQDIYDIDLETLNEINKASKEVIKILDKYIKPNGYKIVQNNGSVQEVKHYHMHIIPIHNKSMDVEFVYELLNK